MTPLRWKKKGFYCWAGWNYHDKKNISHRDNNGNIFIPLSDCAKAKRRVNVTRKVRAGAGNAFHSLWVCRLSQWSFHFIFTKIVSLKKKLFFLFLDDYVQCRRWYFRLQTHVFHTISWMTQKQKDKGGGNEECNFPSQITLRFRIFLFLL